MLVRSYSISVVGSVSGERVAGSGVGADAVEGVVGPGGGEGPARLPLPLPRLGRPYGAGECRAHDGVHPAPQGTASAPGPLALGEEPDRPDGGAQRAFLTDEQGAGSGGFYEGLANSRVGAWASWLSRGIWSGHSFGTILLQTSSQIKLLSSLLAVTFWAILTASCEHTLEDRTGKTKYILEVNVHAILASFTLKHRCPPPFTGGSTTTSDMSIRMTDAWGTSLVLRAGSTENVAILVSAGQDGVFGTSDDLEKEVEIAVGCEVPSLTPGASK